MRSAPRTLLALALTVLVACSSKVDPDRPANVILISIDGLMPSSYTDPAFAAETPHLRALARRGVWADGVVGVLPTVSSASCRR